VLFIFCIHSSLLCIFQCEQCYIHIVLIRMKHVGFILYLQPGSAGIQAVQGLQSLGMPGQFIVAGNPVQQPAIQNNPSVVTITLPGSAQTAASKSHMYCCFLDQELILYRYLSCCFYSTMHFSAKRGIAIVYCPSVS